MKTLNLLLSVLLLSVAFYPSSASGQDETVLIQGQPFAIGNCPNFPQDVVISNCDGRAKAYVGFTIAGISSTAPAMLSFVDDANDTIELKNTIITAAQNAVQDTIVFSGTFAPPPTPDPTTSVVILRSADGSLMRGNLAASGDWFKIDGWIDATEINTWSFKLVTSTIPSYGSFSLPIDQTWTTDLANNRVMKVQFWFYLQNANDTLKVVSALIQTSVLAQKEGAGGGAAGVIDGTTAKLLHCKEPPKMKKAKPPKTK